MRTTGEKKNKKTQALLCCCCYYFDYSILYILLTLILGPMDFASTQNCQCL